MVAMGVDVCMRMLDSCMWVDIMGLDFQERRVQPGVWLHRHM